jgi:omega-6 fatty acid desaturase (delta-12 desaturase)
LVADERPGAKLVRATKPFSEEDPATTWRLFASTVAVFGVLEGLALFAPWWPLQLVGAVIGGAVMVRIFIFFHDYAHGAVFRQSRVGHWLMVAYGWMVLSPYPVWEQTHDYHHRNNAKMLGASIGSYPTVSVKMWHAMNPTQRRWYRFARNPLTMLFGYFTIFMGGMCIASFLREPKTHWQGPAAIVAHLVAFGLVASSLGWASAVFGVFLPVFVATALGAYLFYAQHNFPGAELKGRDAWTYHHAALMSSSMFDMPAVMHWLTGNIGYHHVHHLNHKIPFYKLPEAMAELPELQSPGRTSWRPSDVAACLRLKLWDADRNRLISWSELPPAGETPPTTP